MGGLKKPRVASQAQAGSEKGKEIKIVTKHVVAVGDVIKNPRMLKLLYLISLSTNGISEKALAHIVYSIEKDHGLNLGYNFILLGGNPVSKELTNDLTALKYTGLVEVSLKNRKLYITGAGKEALDKGYESIRAVVEELRKAYESLWPKIAPVDVEVSLKAARK
jgi:hypothetical protein